MVFPKLIAQSTKVGFHCPAGEGCEGRRTYRWFNGAIVTSNKIIAGLTLLGRRKVFPAVAASLLT